eukprot:scaffold174436_cov20-Prasinocladus_malaysianus.AAC.1
MNRRERSHARQGESKAKQDGSKLCYVCMVDSALTLFWIVPGARHEKHFKTHLTVIIWCPIYDNHIHVQNQSSGSDLAPLPPRETRLQKNIQCEQVSGRSQSSMICIDGMPYNAYEWRIHIVSLWSAKGNILLGSQAVQFRG